ncbi:MAG: bifunctional phosphopantothenoylcysteine decarboxylase/phosphopantothenate--cysteine ligase CoaBC [Actinomycetes bacterium]|nr:MAG: bifunctional phosphopantothenoylcysteine decarboxylase/phosphopantothenate--cysteine ligase CoaBC [Actinomycetota bacterium]
MLTGKRVVLAVTGGVAAYKSAYLARRLVEAGAEVEVAMSSAALEFIGAQTFAAITGRAPVTGLFGQERVSPHTELARWADAVVVAPATAATLGKVANGISDDLISCLLLAATCPVLLAPAMHTEMWEHPATQANVERLQGFGYRFVGPESGALAGGDVGIGRVAEPEEVVAELARILGPAEDALEFLVTAGGTREPLDPVRYLGNRSTGKMGHAVADEAARRGHRVTLVTTSDIPVHHSVKVIRVETAREMLEAVEGVHPDVAIMTAAVADFRPAEASDTKIARDAGLDQVRLVPNPDILASVVAREHRPFVVGFAAETGSVERAIEKAKRKGVDLMVYNDVTKPGSGFGSDTNEVTVIDGAGNVESWPQMSKREVAARLLDRVMADVGGRE